MTVYVLTQSGKIHGVFTDLNAANEIGDTLALANGESILIEAHDLESAPDLEPPAAPKANVPDVPEPPRAPSCPNCGEPLTNRVISSVTVCPSCGRSIAFVDGSAMLATATHTLCLSSAEVKALKKLRPKVSA